MTGRKTSPGSRNIVVVGETFAASRTPQRVAAMRRLGHTVRTVPTMPPGVDYETAPSLATRLRYRLRVPADPAGANAAILSAAGGADILWLETARMIRPGALRRLKALNPDTAIVCYSEDDMMNPRNRTVWLQRSMPLIDLWATTKSLNMRPEERDALKLGNMLFVNNSYDTDIHRPVDVGLGGQTDLWCACQFYRNLRGAAGAVRNPSGFQRRAGPSVGERLGEVARAARELED